MLLLDLVEYYISTPCLPEFIVDYCPRDSRKEEHVEEYERYEKYVIRLVVLHRQQLEVRVEIPGSHPVHEIYHPPHLVVVVVVFVSRIWHVCPSRVGVHKVPVECYGS